MRTRTPLETRLLRTARLAAAALAALGLASGAAHAGPPGAGAIARTSLEVPGAGWVLVMHPRAWQASRLPATEPGATKLRLESPEGGKPVSLEITFLADPERTLASPEDVADTVRQIAGRFAGESVEGAVAPRSLASRHGYAAYASFTDRAWAEAAPPAGEYRHATVGAVSLGDVIGSFTLRSNDRESRAFREGMAVLQHGLARVSRAPARSQR